MATVLCIGLHEQLIATRKLMLEQAGHVVITASNVLEFERSCGEHRFDVVVVGQRIPPREKQRIFTLARQCVPEARILELYEQGHPKVLAEADDWLFVPTDVPTDLVERVEALAKKRRES